MLRLFEQHRIRRVCSLDGMWNFKAEGSEKSYSLPVPGCWEQHPDFLSYRGKGIYTKQVDIGNGGNLRLIFKGVSHTAHVSFDGEEKGMHYNAFTPFTVPVGKVESGSHTICVEVDNSFGEYSALHIPNDYYTYGGITRPAAMEWLPDVYIEKIQFIPFQRDGLWHASIGVTVQSISTKEETIQLCARLGEESMVSGEISLPAGKTAVLTMEKAFHGVKSWSPQDPCLYFLHMVLKRNGREEDDLIERVGFRTIQVSGTKLLLNGEEIFLKGFNRHEDYALLGCAIPLQLMASDMDLMRDMGANAVRTCHYPNDERFLDLCDERGILVWEENHARGLNLEDMQNPNFDKQCADCIREMMESHCNHPSIVIWGILNECASETEEGREKYKRQYEQIRSMDSSRPVTSATCRHFTDISLDLPDIVSFNMYSGWYQDVSVEERNRQEIEWIRRGGGEGKPIIVSEMGAAAIYGYRDRSRCKWSEERQADIIRENLDVYMNDPDITGVFIWQFADCRVTEEGGWFSTRARCHNNKGVVDEYRRPKMAYDTVKEWFQKK